LSTNAQTSTAEQTDTFPIGHTHLYDGKLLTKESKQVNNHDATKHGLEQKLLVLRHIAFTDNYNLKF